MSNKKAHGRFLESAPSLVALLGIGADPKYMGKSDKSILNEILLSDDKKKKNIKKKIKTTNTKDNKKNKTPKTDTTKNGKKKKTNSKPNDSKKKTIDKKSKKGKTKGKKKKKVAFTNEKTTVETHNYTKMVTEFDKERKEAELNLLKKQAAAELQRLADENDNLYHDNQVIKAKYDDIKMEINCLNESSQNSQIYKEENDRLKLIISNYKSETVTFQTEIVMLTELLNEHKKTMTDNDNGQELELQNDKIDSIKKLVQEKNDILIEYEELKVLYENIMKENAGYTKQIGNIENELGVVREELHSERQLNFENNQKQLNKISDLNKKMELSKDELLLEYEKKEQQFIQTVEEQLKYIDELENENQVFQKHHTRKVSVDNASGNGMYSLLRMRTQVNIFGNDGDMHGHNMEDFNDGGDGGGDDDDSVSFEFDENNDVYSPIDIVSPVGTFIEHGDDDVGNTLLVTMTSHNMQMDSYSTMNSYLERLEASELEKHAISMEAEERERLAKHNENMERERKEKEKILSEQKQQTKLDELEIETEYKVNKNVPIEQTLIRQLGYFINKNGKLLPLSEEKEEDENDENENKKNENEITLLSFGLDEHIYTQLKNAITIYLFDTLLKYYNFRPKQIGKVKRTNKKKERIVQIDYQYKTLLFSSNFNKIDTLFIIIPPFRGGICYWNLCIDKGIVYGTLLSYIEFALGLNNNKKIKNKNKCGVLLLDPKGLDSNETPYSIFKIYDKFISKKVQHKKIKNIVFIGALKEGNLISHLLDRRGKELKNVVKSCIFLGCDDPYSARNHTAKIYEKCAVNFINSKNKIGNHEIGVKSNGDKYFIPRKSAGMISFCAISAYSKVIETIKTALNIKEEE